MGLLHSFDVQRGIASDVDKPLGFGGEQRIDIDVRLAEHDVVAVRRTTLRAGGLLWMAATVLVLAACGGSDEPGPAGEEEAAATSEARACAHVVGVTVTPEGGAYRFDVTVRSDDRGWDKYADRWEVRGPDGAVLAVRELLHPHETEQPFTRSLGGVVVPPGVARVTVAARDSVVGFCGEAMMVTIPEES